MDLGSGGGAWSGPDGDGGGRILLNAVNVVSDGAIIADGGESHGSTAEDGSGGSIYMMSRTFSGNRVVRADGGDLGIGTGGGGLPFSTVVL